MRKLSMITVAAGVLALAACGGNGNDGNNGDSDSGVDPTGDGGIGIGRDGGGDPDNPDPCKLVDLVFSVDGSQSMTDERAKLSGEVFPGFAQRLINIGQGLDDYRVGVADSCARKPQVQFHTSGQEAGKNPVTEPSEVDCNFASGQLWMTSQTAPSVLEAEFECVGNIWKGDYTEAQPPGDGPCSGDNDDEQPASAAAAMLEESGPTGVNPGFIRSGALLVVVGITDEDEQPNDDGSPSGDNAQDIYNRLVAIKGDVNKMVFLGIGGGVDGDGGCTGVLGDTQQHAQLLEQTTNLFIAQERGVWWDLCGDQPLEDGLDAAMAVINKACNEFNDPVE